jgi:threonine dehydratase
LEKRVDETELPTTDDVRAASGRVSGLVHRTPVLTCSSLDRMSGAKLFLKCENLQKVGAFKARGATNAVQLLEAEAATNGVTTHSSGNHAGALAWAARSRGLAATIVMPRTAPAVKRAAVEGYGARVVECEPTLAAREAGLAEVVARTGATFIHPYNNPAVIAGQGTAALELLDQVEGLDVIVAPVGGGGLLSGTCLAVSAASAPPSVFGAEPEMADDAARSLAAGQILPSEDPQTVADGLRTSLGSLTFAVLSRHVDGILTCSEPAIVTAMRHLWERAKIVVEPSGAVPLAMVMEHGEQLAGLRVGLILTGGNVDLDQLPWSRAGSM